jgi:hypothetical protein
MIVKNIARMAWMGVAVAAGWVVFVNLRELFDFWVAVGVALLVLLGVYSLFYFPLARPLAEALSDRMSVVLHRGRHIRAGSGLDSIPDAAKPLNCAVCGGPGGPICPECDKKLSVPSNRFV